MLAPATRPAQTVIDTNVLASGLLSPAGNEALILLAIHQG